MKSLFINKIIKSEKEIFYNILWLLFEKFYKLTINFFIYALIARHLGPESFGMLNYAIAFVFILSSIIDLGLSGLVVRELVKNKVETNVILGTTYVLKCIASLLGFLVLLCAIYFFDSYEIKIVTLLVGITLLLKPLEVIDTYNQANVKSKFTVMAKNISLTIISLLQILLILSDLSLYYFAASQSLEVFLTVIFMVSFYKKNKQGKWSFDFRLGLSFLKRSWPLIFSGVAAVLYLKVDQIMLQNISGERELGIYSVAARVSEIWYFIPNAIVASLFPKLVEIRNQGNIYNIKLQSYYNTLFILGLSTSLLISISSPLLIEVLFGSEYGEASTILTIHIWASIFVFMRALLSKWLINEDLLMFSLVSHGLGVLINVVLNLILIPIHGGVGAAIATLSAYSASTYIFTFLSKKTFPAGVMMTKAILFPFILFIKFRKKENKIESSS